MTVKPDEPPVSTPTREGTKPMSASQTRDKAKQLAEQEAYEHERYCDTVCENSDHLLGWHLREALKRAEQAEQQLAEQVAEARREGAREALHMGEPWPIPDILNRLAGAAEHLLSVHSCDAHGYEGVDAAIKAARALSDEPPKEGESR